MSKAKVVHYINQFFAGIGGEDMAGTKPHVLDALPPVSLQLAKTLGDTVEVVAAVVCGDSYFNENVDIAEPEVLGLIQQFNPDLVIAGPAFNAGRYGMACAAVTKMVQKQGIKAFTAMYDENPGVDVYRKDIYILRTKDNAAGMRAALPEIAKFAHKMIANEPILSPKEEGYIERGIRVNAFTDQRGSMRAVNMLVKKLKGEAFETEYPMPTFDRVPPNKAVLDITKAKIALVTSGGIVPKHNPDHIESSSASKYGAYDIANYRTLSEADHETAHGGYDPVYANLDPNRVLPVDVLRDMEAAGQIGSLHSLFYTTVGNGTSVANSKMFAAEIAKALLMHQVDAVILTST